MGLDTTGKLLYTPDYVEYHYALTINESGGNRIADTSWGQAGAGLQPNAGNVIPADYWCRFPFTSEVSAQSWSTATLQLTSGNGANCSSFLVDAGFYYVYMSTNNLYAGGNAIALSEDSSTSKATALTGVHIRSTNCYGGFAADPGDSSTFGEGFMTLGAQTRLYLHGNRGTVNANYACGLGQNRVGRDEIHAILRIEKLG